VPANCGTQVATHDLRRTANTLLRVSGVDPAVIRQLAGHESEEMTELYTTRLDSLMQEAVDRLAEKLN
jgi:integrase